MHHLFKLRHPTRYFRPAEDEGSTGGDIPPNMEPHTQLTGRQLAMEQIGVKVDASLAGEFADFDEENGTAVAREPAPLPEPEPEPNDEAIFEPEPAAVADPEPAKPRMVPIVVDGQTIEVDETRIIEAGKRTLQKESAADRRLQEANAIYRRMQALEHQTQTPQPSSDAAANLAPSQDAPDSSNQIRNRALDEATLDQRLEEKLFLRDVQKAAVVFEQEFPDIATDPVLRGYAARLEDERLAHAAAVGEPLGDPTEAYRQHGETVRKWLRERVGTKPAVSEDKQERKRSITAIPAATARAPTPQPPKTLSTSEEIERMRQERMSYGRPLKQTSR